MRAFALSIVEAVRHPLLVLDAGMRVRASSAAFHAAFGVPSGQAEGRSVFALDGERLDIPAVRDLLGRVVATDEPVEGFEVRHDSAGVGARILLLHARRVVSEDDGTPAILLAIEDVTERHRAEDALRLQNDELEARVRERTGQLEAANREMEAFCYSVSHDLRAPLRAIDGFAQELLQSYADRVDDRGRHYLTRVRASSQRMAVLIDDLLQLSRLSRVEMRHEAVDLSALATAVVADLRHLHPDRQVTFAAQLGVTARGDAGLLRVALENLLGNAWKFTSKKPGATIEFGRGVEIDGVSSFVVRDDGAGFDPAYGDKLFGAFQRLHRAADFDGTGIGLATVQRIVRRHGGRIWAHGEVDRGASFHFTLGPESRIP